MAVPFGKERFWALNAAEMAGVPHRDAFATTLSEMYSDILQSHLENARGERVMKLVR
jgi:hypothetical protein